jgi:hypothetical protein
VFSENYNKILISLLLEIDSYILFIYMNNVHVHNFNEYLCEHKARGKNQTQASSLELINVIVTAAQALDSSA